MSQITKLSDLNNLMHCERALINLANYSSGHFVVRFWKQFKNESNGCWKISNTIFCI